MLKIQKNTKNMMNTKNTTSKQIKNTMKIKITKNKQTLGTPQAPRTQWIHEHQEGDKHN